MTKNWDDVHEVVRLLYVVQKRPLSDVRQILEKKHGFYAHERSFRMKLSEWGFKRDSDFSNRTSTSSKRTCSTSNKCDQGRASKRKFQAPYPTLPRARRDITVKMAIERNQSYELKRLLEVGKNGTLLLDDSIPLIHYAAACLSSPSVFRVLLDHGADINSLYFHDGIKQNILQTILIKCSKTAHSTKAHVDAHKSVQTLLARGADLHPEGTGDRKPFDIFLDTWRNKPEWHLALSDGEKGCLGAFLSKGAIIRTPFQSRRCQCREVQTFQHSILFHTDQQITQFVINHVDLEDGGNGSSLLSELLKGCRSVHHSFDPIIPGLVRALLNSGASSTTIDEFGRGPLHYALASRSISDPQVQVECVAELINAGADSSVADSDGSTALDYLARNFDTDSPLGNELADVLVTGIIAEFPESSTPFFPLTNQWRNYTESTHFPETIRTNFKPSIAGPVSKSSLSVATWLYLDQHISTAQSLEGMREILEVLKLRQFENFPEYTIPESFVIKLLESLMTKMEPEGQRMNSNGEGICQLWKYGTIEGRLLQNPLRPLPTAFSSGVFQDNDVTYLCPLCPVVPGVFLETWQYKDHFDQHTRPFVCPERHCEERFQTQEELDAHDYDQHWIICDHPLCGERLKTPNELFDHQQEVEHNYL